MEIVTRDNFVHRHGHRKKRRRTIKLCTNCRLRKTKCDLKKPLCTSCQVKGLEDCEYNKSSPHAVDLINDEIEALKDENKSLNLEIKKLKTQRYLEHSSPSSSPCPTADNTISTQIEKYQMILSKSSRTMFSGPTSMRIFLQNLIVGDYYLSINKTFKDQRSDWKLKNRPKHLAFDSEAHVRAIELLTNLENFLPEYVVLLEYILQFFDGFWYKFLPIVDRHEVIHTFKTYFKLSDSNQRLEIALPDNSHGFANLALIVIILKFSLNSETYLTSTIANKFVDQHDTLLSYATGLLDNAQYLVKTTLPSLQSLFMLRILKKFNVKDVDGGDGSNSNITFAICLEMGITLGLNQDIDFLYHRESKNYRTILKNIWKYLLYYDAVNSFDLGVPLHVSDRCIREELLDSEIFVKTIFQMREVLNIILSPNLTNRDLTRSLNELRSFMNKSFKPLFELVTDFGNATSLDTSYNLIQQFFLSNSLIAMIQHGYSLLYYILKDTKNDSSIRIFNLALKYTMLIVISSVEFIKKVKLLSSKNFTTVVTNQIYTFLMGMGNQWLGRALAFCFFSLFAFMKSLKKEILRNVIDNHIVLKLSSLTDIDNDADHIYDEEYREAENVIALTMVMSRYVNILVFLTTNGEKGQERLVKNVNNYGLFMIYSILNHFKLLVEQDAEFRTISDFKQINFDIIYDIVKESYPSHLHVSETSDSFPILDFFGELDLNITLESFCEDFFELWQ